jgi:chloramphenicol-sensitive protein RarD
VDNHRTGLVAGVSAYLLWGLFPLYWPLLEPAAPVEILAHRIVWSLVFVCGLLALTAGFGWLRTLGRRRAGLLALAATLVTINWGTYIYGVNSEHVVETSLGYFINPLVTVALAVTVLGERLTRLQGVAVAIAAAAVVVLTVDYGRPPYIALTLACSFGLYGLIKKRAGVDGVQSLAFETGFLAPVALAYLLVLGASGSGTFSSEGAGHAALLAAGGVFTAVPLMLVRRGGDPDPAHLARADPVPRPDPAVRDRRPDLLRADARLPAGRLRARLGRARGLHLGRRPGHPPRALRGRRRRGRRRALRRRRARRRGRRARSRRVGRGSCHG